MRDGWCNLDKEEVGIEAGANGGPTQRLALVWSIFRSEQQWRSSTGNRAGDYQREGFAVDPVL